MSFAVFAAAPAKVNLIDLSFIAPASPALKDKPPILTSEEPLIKVVAAGVEAALRVNELLTIL
jgi:hypothetical protein